jgi:hypothetical protein
MGNGVPSGTENGGQNGEGSPVLVRNPGRRRRSLMFLSVLDGRAVAVHPDVVGPELEEHDVRRPAPSLVPRGRPGIHRRIPAPAVVENPGANAVSLMAARRERGNLVR